MDHKLQNLEKNQSEVAPETYLVQQNLTKDVLEESKVPMQDMSTTHVKAYEPLIDDSETRRASGQLHAPLEPSSLTDAQNSKSCNRALKKLRKEYQANKDDKSKTTRKILDDIADLKEQTE